MNKPTIKGKIVEAKVVSVKNIKTVIVTVTTSFKHPLYQKAVRTTKRFAAHNESFELVDGDKVRIQETKPISKTKHYIVIEKLK
jgi:small subunit ribosomal protein S17